MSGAKPFFEPREESASPSVIGRVANELRDEILKMPAGSYLGREEELALRFGVSRPSIRQVARLLEHEELLTVRRGVNGGYYSCLPSVETVTQAAAAHFTLTGISLRELLLTSDALGLEAARLAALSCREPSAPGREELEACLRRVREHGHYSPGERFREEMAILDATLVLAANRPLELFMRAMLKFGMRQTFWKDFWKDPARLKTWKQWKIGLSEAILAGDAEITAILYRRIVEEMLVWIEEDENL